MTLACTCYCPRRWRQACWTFSHRPPTLAASSFSPLPLFPPTPPSSHPPTPPTDSSAACGPHLLLLLLQDHLQLQASCTKEVHGYFNRSLRVFHWKRTSEVEQLKSSCHMCLCYLPQGFVLSTFFESIHFQVILNSVFGRKSAPSSPPWQPP